MTLRHRPDRVGARSVRLHPDGRVYTTTSSRASGITACSTAPRWRTEIQPRIREFIRTIQFKRKVGGGKAMRMSLPYRGLKQDREEIVEYKAPGEANGMTRS